MQSVLLFKQHKKSQTMKFRSHDTIDWFERWNNCPICASVEIVIIFDLVLLIGNCFQISSGKFMVYFSMPSVWAGSSF